jgi:Inositol hexakisphosphate
LHTETSDGTVVPVWEEVTEENILVLKDIMAARRDANGVDLYYNRVPITAEKPPDFADLSDLIDVVMRTSTSTPIVVNCQLGRGRSTLASVRILVLHKSQCSFSYQIILLLIRQWLELHRLVSAPATPRYPKRSMSLISNQSSMEPPVKARHSYQVINSKYVHSRFRAVLRPWYR